MAIVCPAGGRSARVAAAKVNGIVYVMFGGFLNTRRGQQERASQHLGTGGGHAPRPTNAGGGGCCTSARSARNLRRLAGGRARRTCGPAPGGRRSISGGRRRKWRASEAKLIRIRPALRWHLSSAAHGVMNEFSQRAWHE